MEGSMSCCYGCDEVRLMMVCARHAAGVLEHRALEHLSLLGCEIASLTLR
jgi:hypothetical protein